MQRSYEEKMININFYSLKLLEVLAKKKNLINITHPSFEFHCLVNDKVQRP